MPKSIRPIFHLCLVVTAIFAFSKGALAAIDEAEEPNDGKVDVHYSAEAVAPFSERKSDWSTIFSLGVDNFFPDKYRSRVGGQAYEELFGSTEMTMPTISLGTQYNTSIGSLGLSVNYGIGQVSDSLIGHQVKLTLKKSAIEAKFTLDALFDEPYVAPYFGAQFFSIDYDEKSDIQGNDSGATELTSGLTVGVLVQLNPLDPQSALDAQNNVGLDNTYLNIYLSQYSASNAEGDPNFETSFNWGAGFLLDF